MIFLLGNYHFVWSIPEHATLETTLTENTRILEDIRANVPVFHRRALKAEFVSRYGRLAHDAPLGTLRAIYHELTGDESASRTSDEKEVDERIRQAIDMEDPDLNDLLLDLRTNNSSHNDHCEFTVFWEKLQVFLNDQSSVHERRHGDVAYMAKAISVRDLVEEAENVSFGYSNTISSVG